MQLGFRAGGEDLSFVYLFVCVMFRRQRMQEAHTFVLEVSQRCAWGILGRPTMPVFLWPGSCSNLRCLHHELQVEYITV